MMGRQIDGILREGREKWPSVYENAILGELYEFVGAVLAATAAPPPAAAAVEAVPDLWQYRWTNPGNDPNVEPSMLEWAPVKHPHWQSLEQRLQELRDYRYDGKPCYEVRALYAAAPAAPVEAQPDLHARIMDLPCTPRDGTSDAYQVGYLAGHRDARHAAAELVSAALSEAQPVARVGSTSMSAFDEFAEFVTVHNKEKAVPWPIAELFVRTYRAALPQSTGGQQK